MREDFLYYLWKFQKYTTEDLKTSGNTSLIVIHPGFQNELAGPDFFNSKVQIGDQLWAGNVEMHLRSSDWYFHQHEKDPNYDNVILHVVWEDDAEIFRKDGSVIPTLTLGNRVDLELRQNYSDLLEKEHHSINCENDFSEFSEFQMEHWLERLFFERLERKSTLIEELLIKTGNNWEAVLFVLLSRSFGSRVNADAFTAMAQSFDFKLVQKLSDNRFSLEALFLGQADLIKETALYGAGLAKEYDFQRHKYSLQREFLESPQFFRLRPDNFPTLRLAQLAALYHNRKNLFYDLINAKDGNAIKDLLDHEISDYWKTHYNFGKVHETRGKRLSKSFINLIIINCIVPLKHAYSKYIGEHREQSIQDLLNSVPTEKNSIIELFNNLRPKTSTTAMHSQALLQLKSEYCNLNKCLQCELGASLLRKSPKYD